MSREKLREAIESVESGLLGDVLDDPSTPEDDEVAMVLAAARAYLCNCGGWGRIYVDEGWTCLISRPCPDCKEYRKIAEGE